MKAPHALETETVRRLVAECLAGMESEGPSAVEEVLRNHPEHADRVRSRLERLQEAGLLEPPPAAEARFPERLGPFRLLERIGGGGMGVVYLAEQEPLGRQVALKLVRPDLLYFEGARDRFRREVEAAARLKHPGIVPIYTVGEEEGVPYYAMEHVEGRSLDEVLRELRSRRTGRLSGCDLLRAVQGERGGDAAASEATRALAESSWIDACLTVVLQVALVLDHAHRRGVLHRDLKPSNVMLAADGRALLVDFGLACTQGTTRLTRTGSQVGSLPYMAPEQLRGEEVDERTDLYGLGVTLYELLALRLPYAAPDPEETRRRILAGAPAPIRAANPAVPWDVETVCLTAMEADRGRRYASAAALVEDLRAVLGRRPIAARRPGSALRAKRFVQRNPTWSTAAALGGLLVAGSVAFGVRQHLAGRELARAVLAKDEALRELRAANAAKDVALRETGEALEVASAAEARAREELEATEAVLEFLNEDLLRSPSPKLLGRDASMREALDAASAMVEGRFPRRPRIEAAIRTSLGKTYLDLGRIADSEDELERARELVTAAGAEDRPLAFENLAALADLAFHQGRSAEAFRLYERALAGRRATLGQDHPATLVALSNLGGMLAVSGRADEGEPLLAEAVRGMTRVLGEQDLRTLSAMTNHVTALRKVGRLEEGLALAEHAAELSRRHLGDDNGHTLTALHNLGTHLAESGRHEEALPILAAVVEDADRVLGWDHPQTLLMADSLAAVYLELDRPEDAGRILEDAFARLGAAGIDLAHERLGHLHTRWGKLMRARGRLDEAGEAFGRAHDAMSRFLGPDHPQTLTALENLAHVHLGRGDHGEAERLFARAIERDREGGHAVFKRRLWRVDCLRELARFEEAERELARVAATVAAEEDPRAPGAVLERARSLYVAWGRPDEIGTFSDELSRLWNPPAETE